MLSLAVVCEAPADQRTGCGLADRVFCTEIEWLEPGTLDAVRQWRGFAVSEGCLLWRDAAELARKQGIRAHGHFEGRPGDLDAAAARRVLLLLHAADRRPDGVVLLRDDDNTGHRRRGLEQARQWAASRTTMIVAIGLACANRECWVLAGFEPADQNERERLRQVREELGFDPRENAHELTARHLSDKRSAKRVLHALTEGDPDREARCWREANLELLAARGAGSGLASFLREVRELVTPLFRK